MSKESKQKHRSFAVNNRMLFYYTFVDDGRSVVKFQKCYQRAIFGGEKKKISINCNLILYFEGSLFVLFILRSFEDCYLIHSLCSARFSFYPFSLSV